MEENIISIEDAFKLPNSIFIDVRSEGEYSEACIPDSINMPILKDEERAVVGRAYRKEGIDKARNLGIKYASYKLEDYYKEVLKLREKYENVIIYCWRGGMRSKSVCGVLSTLNIDNVYQLKGGYKAYRRLIIDFFENEIKRYKFIVLHGLTGVGKTIIIDKLKNKDIPVINFERLAKNSGSVFGDMLFEGQPPSQKQFESYIFKSIYNAKHKFIVTESESKRIGYINIPDSLIDAMSGGYHILIETSMKNRIDNIYNDYVKNQLDTDEKLIKSIKHLNKRLGSKNVENLITKINNRDYNYVIEYLFKNYYDPLYKYSIKKINDIHLKINYGIIDEAVGAVDTFIQNNIIN